MVNWVALDYASTLAGPTDTPMYQRIVSWLRRLITEGHLHEGDTLPTEREFARLSGLSRGTVSLAYAELKREGILTATPGRGSRVASDKYVSTGSRKEQAIRILSNALERLEALGFGERDIEAFLHLLQLGREGRNVNVRAALVDCNPEALELVAHQLENISHLSLVPLQLDELARLTATDLAAFDLVITTERHTPQILGQLARLAFPLERVLSVAVAPSRETLVTLARLPEQTALAVRTTSERFGDIIHSCLSSLGHTQARMLAPAEVPAPGERLLVPAARFPKDAAGLGSIPFDYQVDRGSLLRVEEAVTSLLLHKNEGVMGGI